MDRARIDEILRAGGLDLPPNATLTIDGNDPVLGARFAVGEAAAAVAIAACGAAAADVV